MSGPWPGGEEPVQGGRQWWWGAAVLCTLPVVMMALALSPIMWAVGRACDAMERRRGCPGR